MGIYFNGHHQATIGGGLVDYTVNEQNTGLKWRDGKPIYQRTVVMGSSIDLSPNGTTIPAGIFADMNIDHIINTVAYREAADNRDGIANVPVSLWKNGNTYNMYSLGTWAGVHTFTIQYTKTTDQGNNTPVISV